MATGLGRSSFRIRRSRKVACSSVRGEPSSRKPEAQSGCRILAATIWSTTSSPTRPPDFRMEQAKRPRSVPALHSARNISPVEMAGIWKRWAIDAACVPLPQPGGPNNKTITVTSGTGGSQAEACAAKTDLQVRQYFTIGREAHARAPPFDRVAGETAHPDGEAPKVAQGDPTGAAERGGIAQPAPAHRDSGEQADGERRHAGRPCARGDGDDGPECGVGDQVAITLDADGAPRRPAMRRRRGRRWTRMWRG